MELNYIEIGERLRKIRGDLSQTKFGEKLGYQNGYIRNCELGKKPSLEYLNKIKEHYSCSIEWILYGENPIGLNKSPEISSEIKEMVDVLEYIVSDPNTDIHIWAKIQFKKAFLEYYELLGLDKSKRPSSVSTSIDENASTVHDSNIA